MEISHSQTEETQKDLQIQVQQRDFQDQLVAEQTAHQQVSSTLEVLQQELEALRSKQNGHNPMDVSSTTDANNELNREREKAEEEKCLLTEKLTKTQAKYEQALKDKNRKITSEIKCFKKNMEDQMRKEREQAAKASKNQLKAIMSELHWLKEKQEKDFTDRKAGKKVLLDNTKGSIDPILKSDHKPSNHIHIGACLKHLQEEVTNYLAPTVNKKCAAAIYTDDTFSDWTHGGAHTDRHVHFTSTPIKPEVSYIHLTTLPHAPKEETITESILQNMMQTLASEFKRSWEPKIQKFRGGTSSGALLMFQSWMQDIQSTIKDHNLSTDKALQLVKEFSAGSTRDNINFYLKVTERLSIEGLFKNLKQVFSLGEDGQQMLTEFYSHMQSSKESVIEFGESLLQIARKIMMAKPEFKIDIDNTLKAHFADGLKDHPHQAIAREMIHSYPLLNYVAYKSEVLKTLGPNVKPQSITVSKLEMSDIESLPKKHKSDSELDQKINAALEENRKLSEHLSTFDPKTITDTVINAVQGNVQGGKPQNFGPKQFKSSLFYGKPREPQLVSSTNGLLKPNTDCNYCKDLGYLKYNCPRLKEKEARMAGQQNYQKSKQGN